MHEEDKQTSDTIYRHQAQYKQSKSVFMCCTVQL